MGHFVGGEAATGETGGDQAGHPPRPHLHIPRHSHRGHHSHQGSVTVHGPIVDGSSVRCARVD